MRHKTRKAFTMVEMLLAIIVTAIVGGASLFALWFAFNTYYQLEDYSAAEVEIEHAIQRLSREFALIGLGMPNNRGELVETPPGSGTFVRVFRGSFVQSFLGSNPSPITSQFGLPDDVWGGPVTVAGGTSDNFTVVPPAAVPGHPNPNFSVGPQLFYAWGVPTGVRARIPTATGQLVNMTNATLALHLYPREITPGAGVMPGADALENTTWEGRPIGFQTIGPGVTGENIGTWLLLPTLLLPMRAESFAAADTVLNVRVAPDDFLPPGVVPPMNRRVMALDEIHLMQAARLFREGNELVRVNLAGGEREVLARNIVGLQFEFNPEERIITMYIAAQGFGGAAVRDTPTGWPGWAPALEAASTSHRIAVRAPSWRIRN